MWQQLGDAGVGNAGRRCSSSRRYAPGSLSRWSEWTLTTHSRLNALVLEMPWQRIRGRIKVV